MEGLRAVIYVGSSDAQDVEKRRCVLHCDANGYQLTSIIIDTDGQRWRDAFAALGNGDADILIVCNRDDLNPNRVPRVESAGDRPANTAGVSHQRRPRRV